MTNLNTLHLVVIILIASIILSVFNGGNPVHISNLDGKYLIKAVEFYEKGEWSFFKRGPIYTLLISLGFNIFGNSIEVVIWITQLFYFASILLIFFIGSHLFGKWVGFLSSIYALLSIPLFKASWDIDPGSILSFFILSSVLSYLIYIRDFKKKYLIISGIFLGLAMLTKEAALFFIVFPLILNFISLKKEDIKIGFSHVSIFYFFFFLTITPWLIFIYSNNLSPLLIFGEFLPSGGANLGLYTNSGVFDFLRLVIFNGVPTTIITLFRYEPFFILIIIGILFSIFKSFKGEKNHQKYIALILLTAPVFAVYGIYMDGYRQLMPQLMLLYISIGTISIMFFRLNKFYLVLLFVILLISITITYFLNYNKLQNYSVLNIINERVTGKFNLKVNSSGRMNDEVRHTSIWINNNLNQESNLLVGGVYDDSIKYLTELKFLYKPNLPKYYELETLVLNEKYIDDQIISITSLKTFKSNQKRYRNLFILFKKDYEAFIKNYFEDKNNYFFNYSNENFQDKILFPIVIETVHKHSSLIYNEHDIKIYKPGRNNSDLEFEYSKNIFALGSSISDKFSWLNTKDDLIWLKNNYKTDYLSYKRYLQKYDINIDNM